jgi:uncharacterized membrane protein
MATRDLIRDIVEAGKASIADPTSKIETNEAGTTSAIVVCYALGELLDDLVARVASLEDGGAVPADMRSQLDEIREDLVRLETSLKESARKSDKKKKKKKAKK